MTPHVPREEPPPGRLAVAIIGVLALLPVSPSASPAPCHDAGCPQRQTEDPVADFNGDGYSDLAVGAPYDSVGDVGEAGSVVVLYGSSEGLTSVNSQLLTQNETGSNETAESGDRYGTALAAGDFDGDSFSDLAIGVPGENLGEAYDAGVVEIVYGSPSGLDAERASSYSQATPGIASKPEPTDNFGQALVSGDFGLGPEADLAIGVPRESVQGQEAAGAAHVLFGTSDGLAAQGSQFWHQGSQGIAGAPEKLDSFGAALGAGEFGRGPLDDLAVGRHSSLLVGGSSPAQFMSCTESPQD